MSSNDAIFETLEKLSKSPVHMLSTEGIVYAFQQLHL